MYFMTLVSRITVEFSIILLLLLHGSGFRTLHEKIYSRDFLILFFGMKGITAVRFSTEQTCLSFLCGPRMCLLLSPVTWTWSWILILKRNNDVFWKLLQLSCCFFQPSPGALPSRRTCSCRRISPLSFFSPSLLEFQA